MTTENMKYMSQKFIAYLDLINDGILMCNEFLKSFPVSSEFNYPIPESGGSHLIWRDKKIQWHDGVYGSTHPLYSSTINERIKAFTHLNEFIKSCVENQLNTIDFESIKNSYISIMKSLENMELKKPLKGNYNESV